MREEAARDLYLGSEDSHELLRRNHRPRSGCRPIPALTVQWCGAARKRHPGGASEPGQAQGKQIKLAYCSQLLCGLVREQVGEHWAADTPSAGTIHGLECGTT